MNLLITITISAFNGLMVYNVCEQELFNWDGTYQSALEFLNSKEVNPLPIEDESDQESFASEVSNFLEKNGAIQIEAVNAEGFNITLIATEVKPQTTFQPTNQVKENIMTTTKVQLTFPTQAQESITQALFSMRESIIEDNPELGDDFEEMDEVMENLDLIMEMAIKVMGKHLSNEEIHFLNDLYTHPLLLSIMSKYPAMVKDAVEAGKTMAQQEFLMENH